MAENIRTSVISTIKKWNFNNESFAKQKKRGQVRGTEFQKDLLNSKEGYGEKDGMSDMVI